MKKLLLSFLLLSSPVPVLAGECPRGPYVYWADVTKVYDADTVTVDIDLGFHTWRNDENLRLFGINAPEVRGKEKPGGIISRDWLREQIAGKTILVQTIKYKNKLRGKYGRYLAKIYLKEGDNCTNLNDELVSRGLAEYKEY